MPFWRPKIEIEVDITMASFDEALAKLSSKVDAILAVVELSDEAVAAARRAAAEAEANAERVVSEDAAEDAAQDSARAQALAAVTAKLDAALKPRPAAEDVVEAVEVEPGDDSDSVFDEVAAGDVALEAVVAEGEEGEPEAQ